MNFRIPLLCSTLLILSGACARTDITLLTQAPPGRTASLDVETRTITLSRGLAVAVECTESGDEYSGPCRGLTVALDDSAQRGVLADVLPVHLDALVGDAVTSSVGDFNGTDVSGPSTRQGVILTGKAEGTGGLTVTTSTDAVALTLVVAAAPTPPDGG